MPGPQYITRSYGGGAVVAQLLQEVGSQDTSFAIGPVTGWTDANGNPLGTTGPFSVVIDRFTSSEEKILCSAINLITGTISVYTSGGFSGRGYDGTTAQAHVPGGSSSGVQNCWTAEEAFEANALVAQVLGPTPTPSNAEVFTWSGTGGIWAAPGAISPLGQIAYAQITTNQSAITGLTAISGLSVSPTIGTGRQIKVTGCCYQFASAGGGLGTDQYGIYVMEGATQLGEVIVLAGSGGMVQTILTPTAGAHTYSISGNHVTGSNAGVFGSAVGAPSYILVEDMGT